MIFKETKFNPLLKGSNLKTETNSAVTKITDNFAVLFPAGKLDSCNPEASTAAKDARVLMSKLEKLKAFGSAYASIEVSSYVKELVACSKTNSSVDFFKESDQRNISAAG